MARHRKPGKPGERVNAAHCLDCDSWTEWASDGTIILRHKPECPQNPHSNEYPYGYGNQGPGTGPMGERLI